MKWPRVTIATEDGPREAAAPEIISASRSTDIPAFHAEWLARRLAAGYCRWVNPFNQQPHYISFQNARAFVFWTKNAEPLLPHLAELDRRGIIYYFQFTVNDYEEERLEPGVPPLARRLETFRQLSGMIGRARVIWRFDPLVLARSLTVQRLVERVIRVGEVLRYHTEKLVFSFADIGVYAKVSANLRRHGVDFREFAPDRMREFARLLAERTRGWGVQLATCAESLCLEEFGILHNKCVDDALLLRLAPEDLKLREVLGRDMYGDLLPGVSSLKDEGQREACGCVISKDIGQYNTCPSLCLYCYANTSPGVVRRNREQLAESGESIVSPAKQRLPHQGPCRLR
jgi:hypothetical protein